MIRRATLADIPKAVSLCLEFNKESGRPMGTPEDWARHCDAMIRDEENQVIFLSDKGIIGGVVCQMPYRPHETVAYETLWWAADGKGLELAASFEAWAKSHGAYQVVLTQIAGIRRSAGKVMRRMGYSELETSFGKVL